MLSFFQQSRFAPKGERGANRVFRRRPVGRPEQRDQVAGGLPVTSPMPGTVMKITTAVGQHVVKDQELMILEAMKMESPIYAPCDGTVASILVKESDAVVEGQVLVQLS